jgi:hypothetical protein
MNQVVIGVACAVLFFTFAGAACFYQQRLAVGTHGWCLPRHQAHFDPWFPGSNDIL